MESLIKLFGGVTLVVLVFFGLTAYDVWAYSYVADTIWDWFAITTFPTLPNFTRHEFVAIFVLKAVFLYKTKTQTDIKDEYKKDNSTANIVGALFTPWFLLLFAWTVKTFFF